MWDTIIVGGGSAGCVLAERLSADPSRRVLLVEAGPRDTYPWIRVPVGYFKTVGNPRCDWCLETEPEPHLDGRRLMWPRGKVLGGSSAINGLIAIRGQPEDYDAWRERGCTGWGWEDVFPYFRRLEDQERGADAFHGAGGPLPISDIPDHHEICDAYVRGAQEIGIPANPDFNGGRQEGVGYYQITMRHGVRVSTARAYLGLARRRPNLQVITDATVHRLILSGRRATGIVYAQNGAVVRAEARRQVILSAGVVFSPQLLELSGIGDGARLQALGIEVAHALPAVGQNLQDHLQSRSIYRATRPTLNGGASTVLGKAMIALNGLLFSRGPWVGLSQVGIFARTDPAMSRPDVQFHICPVSSESGVGKVHPFPGFTVSVCVLRPESRGRVETRSPDPTVLPAVHANYLATETDRRTMIAALRIGRRLAATSAVRPYIDEELWPGPGARSDEQLMEFVRRTAMTTYHPVGTCRMGSDDASVVDLRLRVRGVDGLYVVDASVMPNLVSGNTHIPTVMIAEKAADLIMEDERSVTSVEISPRDRVTLSPVCVTTAS